MNNKLFAELEESIKETNSKLKKELSETDPENIERIEFLTSLIKANQNCIEDLKQLIPKSSKNNVKEMYEGRKKDAKKNHTKTRKRREN